MITIRLYANLREKLGSDNVVMEASTVAEALSNLESQFGTRFHEELYENGKIKDYYIFLLNGLPISTKELDQISLSTGDVLHILPAIAGG